MALTSADEIKLRNSNFVAAFEQDKKNEIWLPMADQAYRYAKITLKGQTPKPDDVAPHLALALEVDEGFNKLRGEKRATGHYWYRLFADLILDRTMAKLGTK